VDVVTMYRILATMGNIPTDWVLKSRGLQSEKHIFSLTSAGKTKNCLHNGWLGDGNMKKYRAWASAGDIQEVEVLRETEHFVILPSRSSSYRREAKRTEDYYCFFDTWQEAKDYMIAKVEKEMKNAEWRVLQYEERLRQIRALTRPGGEAPTTPA
jgi:hypothetical protein